jgi:hypothetical protein
MPNHQTKPNQTEAAAAVEIEKQLKAVFEKMPHQVPLYLFTQSGQNDDPSLSGSFRED